MDRNPNAPAFPQSSYSVSLSESFPLLGQVILLVASDPDGDLIEYELLYDGVSSPEYFLLESGSGKVLLRSSLRESPLTSVIFKVGKMLYSPRGHFKDACTCVSVFLFLVQTLISCFNIKLNCSDTNTITSSLGHHDHLICCGRNLRISAGEILHFWRL